MDTKDNVIFHELVAYLKGEIVGYGVSEGFKYGTEKPFSPQFQLGYDNAFSSFVHEAWVTIRHIFHNRLRQTDRCHTGSLESDNEYLNRYSGNIRVFFEEVEDACGSEARTMLEGLL